MKAKYFILIVFSFVGLVFAKSSSKFDSSIPPQAAAAIESGNFKQVEEILKPLAESDDASEDVKYWYGAAQYHQSVNTIYSIEALKKAFAANPTSRNTARLLASAAGKMKYDKEKAIEILEPLLQFFGDDPVILQAVAKIQAEYYWSTYRPYEDLTQTAIHLEKAIEYLQKAIAIEPLNIQLHLDMVDVLEKLGRREKAIEHILIIDRLEPLGFEAYIMLGQLYSRTGDHDNACDAFKLAAELSPANAHQVEWDLANELMQAKRYAEAVEVFSEIFRRDNKNLKVRFMLGRAAYEDGNYPTALFGFREAYKVDQNIQALAWSARCAYDLGQDDLAVELVNRAIKEDKAGKGDDNSYRIDEMWRFVRGRALWQMGKKMQAIDDLEQAAITDPSNDEFVKWAIYAFRDLNDPYGVLRIASEYGKRKNPKEAMEVIRNIRKMWLFMPPAQDCRGKRYREGIGYLSNMATAAMYEEMGKYRTAAELYYMAGWKQSGKINTRISWVLYRGGMELEALEMIKKLTVTAKTDTLKQDALKELAVMSLVRGDGHTALESSEAITNKYYRTRLDNCIKWADVFSGKEAAVNKLDKFDLLGIYSDWFEGLKFDRGMKITQFISGSPLLKTQPSLKIGDIIVRVGKNHLNCSQSVENLRKTQISDVDTPLLIRRGEKTFQVNVNFHQVRNDVINNYSK